MKTRDMAVVARRRNGPLVMRPLQRVIAERRAKPLDRGCAAPLDSATAGSGGAERRAMRNFLAGLLLGLAGMYWYIYQKDDFVLQVENWFAEASYDPGGPRKLDKPLSQRR